MAHLSGARTYQPSECAVFMKTDELYGGLSNMAPGYALCVEGILVRTSEALYQACRFPHLPEVQQVILTERSPMTAKMRGKPFRAQTRPDWNEVRVPIMRWCLRVKLAQHYEKFANLLLSTAGMPIVEKKIRRTDFWGAKVTPDGQLIGQNVLGRLLMELRENLHNEPKEKFLTVRPPSIPYFRILNHEIGIVSGIQNPTASARMQEPLPFNSQLALGF